MTDSLEKYHFPESLDVKIITNVNTKLIQFILPTSLRNDVKDSLFREDFYKSDPGYQGMVIGSAKNAKNTYQIKGGKNGIEGKIKVLLYILKNVIYNGKPVFEAEYIPVSKYQLPTNRFRFLCAEIPINVTEEQIDQQYKEQLKLDIFGNFHNDKNAKKESFKQNPLQLTTEETYLLVSIFAQEQIPIIKELIQDENHDPQLFQLNIPVPVNVTIKYVEHDQYEMNFSNDGKVKSIDFYNQVSNALKSIKSQQCIRVTFDKTDPVETEELTAKFDKETVVVVIPDEETDEEEEEYAITYVEIFLPEMNDEPINKAKEIINEYFKNIQLAVCKKCGLYYSPNTPDQICYTYFHKGRQIPLESGQMEELVYVFDSYEVPFPIVNYTCCGEVPKDEIPLDCGKRENGKHEMDIEGGGIFSELRVSIESPGTLRL